MDTRERSPGIIRKIRRVDLSNLHRLWYVMRMQDWIPFEEGSYRIEKAYLVAPDYRAVDLKKAYINVFKGSSGRLQMDGRGLAINLLVVQLLEESDELDLLVDLGGEFKYRIANPDIKSGKFFSPNARSTLRFAPTRPWQQIPVDAYQREISKLVILDGESLI